ncbi:hypothetical protein [Paenibacillus flagellatus]|uniref:Polyprenyl synthetase n=1 Tax=Paenibacillus flagellatus TaxID=2211139 RepID=A0A2V5KLJ0_9BACL|nr:hypothetical protein [Paenibacillus flagellatus]PYI55900.1 hypothetical protein DLM86_09315 [Paenibacillus flagellatus]
MNWFTDYETELAIVFAEAEARIGTFPSPLAGDGLAYLQSFHPLREGSTKNYICYLLPYWLKDAAGIDEAACRRIALANVFVMLHYFVLDDLMDTVPGRWKETLALGQLFRLQAEGRYRAMFDSTSPFWSCYETYATEWADAVANEGKRDDFFERPARIAHKASPVKLASAAALLLGGRGDRIEGVSALVDCVLVTLQMADDRADWREDLREGGGCGNVLLALVRRERGLSHDAALTEEDVKQTLYAKGGLTRYAAIAEENHARLLESELRIAPLAAFHESIVRTVREAAESIERQKKALQAGGFSYWLSKNAFSS